MRNFFKAMPALVTAFAFSACIGGDAPNEEATNDPAPAPAAQPAPPPPDLELEVDLAARQVRVSKGGQVIATHPVAVGSKEWPTPTGEWTIGQVIFNPRWNPPTDESWAKDEKVAEPGAKDNPLGRVQLIYSPPNTIHGTNDPSSVGKAVSHGSLRVTNEVGELLARQIMEAGGAPRDEAFFQQVKTRTTERVDIDIPNPIKIRVIEGTAATTTTSN